MSQNKLKDMNGGGDSSAMNGAVTELQARKASLTPLEYRVTQQRETERPFSNKYNKFWESGSYHCIVCDAELFKSETKFESKSGWPAFYNVVDPQRVKLTPDLSHVGANLLLLVAKPDLARTEVSCANCNAHLGHLFKDGPKPTGLRYCINSASLNFVSMDGLMQNNTHNLHSPTSVPKENGVSPARPSQVREYICNPENTCSRQAFTPSPPPAICQTPGQGSNKSQSLACTPTAPKDFGRNSSARDNFFSSFESNSLPPMGALCLNNQSCQRIPPAATVKKASGTEESANKSLISNGAENNVRNGNGLNNMINNRNKATGNLLNGQNSIKGPLQNAQNANSNSSSSANKNGNTGTTTIQVSTSKTNTNNTSTTTTPATTVSMPPVTLTSTKARSSFSKGASLTAARINFFQKIVSSKDSPSPSSRWAATFNSRWSSKKSSSSSSPSSNNTHQHPEQENIHNGNGSASSSRFPSSCSSGSLCMVTQDTPKPEDVVVPQPRRSTSSFFSNNPPNHFLQSPSISIERVSTAPRTVSLRETTL